MLLASLCFVHCVAGPILLTYAGFSSSIGVSEKFEALFVLGSAAMGLIAFVPAYRKKHGRKSCLALFASGISCLLLRSHIELPSIPIEPIVTAVGRQSDHLRAHFESQVFQALPVLRSLIVGA